MSSKLLREDFSQNFLNEIKNLKPSDNLSDVTLICDGGKVNCHKLVLTASSPYFKKTFKENAMEQHPVLILVGMEFEDLEALVTLMYKGEVVVKDEMMSTFLRTASLLKVRGLAPVDGEGDESEIEEESRTEFLSPLGQSTNTNQHLSKATKRDPVTKLMTPPKIVVRITNSKKRLMATGRVKCVLCQRHFKNKNVLYNHRSVYHRSRPKLSFRNTKRITKTPSAS